MLQNFSSTRRGSPAISSWWNKKHGSTGAERTGLETASAIPPWGRLATIASAGPRLVPVQLAAAAAESVRSISMTASASALTTTSKLMKTAGAVEHRTSAHICYALRPTGKSGAYLSSLFCKNIPVHFSPKSPAYASPSRPTEGRLAIVTDAGRDAMDARSAKDESAHLADSEAVWS